MIRSFGFVLIFCAFVLSCGPAAVDGPGEQNDESDPENDNGTGEENGVEHEWVTPAVDSDRIDHRTFHSEAVGEDVSYHIFVPMPYDNMSETEFPVLYWLHGGGGGIEGIVPLAQHFAAAMQQGLVPTMLVVFPNGLELGMWVDWKDGSVPMETILMDELIPHIDDTFRTITSRDGRIVEGFSMGGYGAARLAFKYHDVFSAASILGGGPLQLNFDETPRVGREGRERVFQDVYGGCMDYYQSVSPWLIAEENAAALAENSRIRIAIGELDPMLDFNEDFHEHLKSLDIPHEFHIIPDVGHDAMPLRQGLGEEGWDFYH